jgi:hypothetical protein
MRSLVAVLVLLIAVPALANDAETMFNSPAYGWIDPVPGPVYQWERVVLYDNGPVNNYTQGTQALSVLQDTSLGHSTYGYGNQISAGNRVADDFEVPVGETWLVQTITFFGYQTGSTTTSTFTTYYVQLWKNGPPDVGTLVFGDLATNRLATSVFASSYRTLESSLPTYGTTRPIMASTCNVPITLGPGQYWVDWTAAGTLASGPWQPPVSIWNQGVTGDGLQKTSTGWAYVLNGTDNQGFPFVVEGTYASAVETATWGGIKALYR